MIACPVCNKLCVISDLYGVQNEDREGKSDYEGVKMRTCISQCWDGH